MKDHRQGNDLAVLWSILKDGEPFDLRGRSLKLYLKNLHERKEVEDFSVTGNKIHWTFYGKDQDTLGKHSLILVVNEDKKGMITTDACDFVRLVSCSCKLQGGEDAPNVETESIELTTTLEYVAGSGQGGDYDDTALWNELEKKVDKEEGLGLSTNDYTDKEKEKLAGLENYDDSGIKEELKKKIESEVVVDTESTEDFEFGYDDTEIRQEIADLSSEVGKKVDADKVATINGQTLVEGGNITIEGGKGEKGDKGDKGDQGNSGYTGAADELEVVNNLTQGGATAALSAEMGKELSAEVGKKLTGQWVETSGFVVSYAPTGGGIVKNTIDVDLLEGDILNVVQTNPSNQYTYFVLAAISKDGKSQNILQIQGGSILVGNWGEIVVPFDTIQLSFQSYAGANVDITYIRRYWESLDVKLLREELTKEGSLGAEMLNKKRFIASINPHGAGDGNIIETHVSLKKGDILGIERVNPKGNYNFFILKIEDESGNQSIVFKRQDAIIIGEWDNILIPFDAVKILINGYSEAWINIFLTRQSKKAESEHDYLESRWGGKKWLLIGDSISTEWENYVKIGYGNLIAKYFNFGLLNNIAKSGKTMQEYYTEVDSYNEDYDLVTIMLGTNNQGYNTAIGALNDEQYQNGTAVNNNESFIASTQMLYEKLHQKYPNATIVFITPIRRCSTGQKDAYNVNVLGLTTKDYAEAVKEVCQYYAIPCIDIYDSVSPLFEDIRERYFINADGTHPNEAAHAKFIAPIIAGELFKFAPFVE